MRDCAWRFDPTDADLTAVDKQILRAKGMKSKKGFKTYDWVRCLSHILALVCRTSLSFFVCLEQLGQLRPGEYRYYSVSRGRWVWKDKMTGETRPELPDSLLQFQLTPVLLLSVDQCSVNWSGAHYMAAVRGHNVNVHFVVDEFHRSWNDFKQACRSAYGGFWHTVLQMVLVYNLPYGPWLSAAWMSERQEALDMLLRDGSLKSVAVMPNLEAMSLDCGHSAPVDEEGAAAMFEERVLDSSLLRSKGPYVKMMRFYSYLEAVEHYSRDRTAWKTLITWINASINGDGPVSDKARDRVAKALVQQDETNCTKNDQTVRQNLQEHTNCFPL